MEIKYNLIFPDDFLFGSAISAFQTEGGDTNNSWYDWCLKGHIKDNSNCVRGCDFWNKYEEDIKILKELNQKTFRLGIEWARVEPEENKFDINAINHYRKIINTLVENNILPIITIHHFSNPIWLEKKSGWESNDIINYFTRYVEILVSNLGDIVSDWITINEPNVFSFFGYLEGTWPPGKKDVNSFFNVVKNIIITHIKAYKVIHNIRNEYFKKNDTKVGVSFNFPMFEPDFNPLSIISTKLVSYIFIDLFTEGMINGKLLYPIGNFEYYEGKNNTYIDFLGVNYYSRKIVSFTFNPKNLFAKLSERKNSLYNDLGWEIYPKGIYKICKKMYKKYKKPIFITENGIADNSDKLRIDYIMNHLIMLHKLIKEKVPIKRYYHWSYIDNFELLEGESARFGLVFNDFTTQERKIKNSGYFYSEICKQNGITLDIIKKYIHK